MKAIRWLASFGLLLILTYSFFLAITLCLPPLKRQDSYIISILTSVAAGNRRSVASQLEREASALMGTADHRHRQ